MSWSFKKLVKGASPTLLQATLANKVLDALNALSNITIAGGKNDEVKYTKDGVYIYYKSGADLNGTIRALDPANFQQINITVEKGVITRISRSASGISQKNISVCEGGSTKSYKFLIKS